jgi:hypothetical protein
MVAKTHIPDLDNFFRKMRDFPDDVEDSFPDQMAEPLRKGVDAARGLAPRLTGRLIRSIESTVDGNVPMIGADSTVAPHARIIESGGSHPVWGNDPLIPVKARPFLEPAVEQMLDDVMDAAGDAVMKAGREAGFR